LCFQTFDQLKDQYPKIADLGIIYLRSKPLVGDSADLLLRSYTDEVTGYYFLSGFTDNLLALISVLIMLWLKINIGGAPPLQICLLDELYELLKIILSYSNNIFTSFVPEILANLKKTE
jgi:hypothetical protein